MRLCTETVEALRASLKRRYAPREEAAGRDFIIMSSKTWDSCNPICKQLPGRANEPKSNKAAGNEVSTSEKWQSMESDLRGCCCRLGIHHVAVAVRANCRDVREPLGRGEFPR